MRITPAVMLGGIDFRGHGLYLAWQLGLQLVKEEVFAWDFAWTLIGQRKVRVASETWRSPSSWGCPKWASSSAACRRASPGDGLRLSRHRQVRHRVQLGLVQRPATEKRRPGPVAERGAGPGAARPMGRRRSGGSRRLRGRLWRPWCGPRLHWRWPQRYWSGRCRRRGASCRRCSCRLRRRNR